MVSELNIVKKQAQKMQIKFDALQAEYEAEKISASQILETYNSRCKDAEQAVLEEQQIIAELKANADILKEQYEKKLNEVQGMYTHIHTLAHT